MTLRRVALYRPVKPDLVSKQPFPGSPIRLGIACCGFSDAKMIARSGPRINLIEVQPWHFNGPDKLFYFKDEFKAHRKNFARLVAQARKLELAIQFHFPPFLENQPLDPGFSDQHAHISSLLKAMAEVIKENAPVFLPNVTMHLPDLQAGVREKEVDQALANTNRLLRRLSEEIKNEGWPVVVGLENKYGPHEGAHPLGYSIGHFIKAMAGTGENLQLTFDAGHRTRTRGMLEMERDLLPFAKRTGKRIVNFHLHEPNLEKRGEHQLPFGGKIPGTVNYLRRAVQERIPVVLEVTAKECDPEQFLFLTNGYWQTLAIMEEERASADK